MNKVLWQFKDNEFKNTDLFKFKTLLEKKLKSFFPDYYSFWQWSVKNKEIFWAEAWDFFQIRGFKGNVILEKPQNFIESKWFPEAKLNFAENLLSPLIHSLNKEQPVLFFQAEDKIAFEVTKSKVLSLVSKMAQALKNSGLKKGDRVCGMVPNHPLTLVAMLATTSLGGVWTSCSPDFGVQGVLDRFIQVEPKFFISCDFYFYNGKKIDCLNKTAEIIRGLPSLKKSLVIEFSSDIFSNTLDAATTPSFKIDLPGVESVAQFLNPFADNPLEFEKVEFNHPLYILYSSGTTGIPKCIVHGHGGTLIQHLKEHRFHCDLKKDDVLFYFTTCGWMMWNWLVSGLASQAKLLLYDGSPFFDQGNVLFKFIEKHNCTHFGVSAKFIDTCAKTHLSPKNNFDLSSVKVILSTGSPLNPEGFDYVYEHLSSTAQLASISGGTDIVSCFVLGSPWTFVYRGEISAPGLAMDIDIWDENKKSLVGQKGELVCKSTFPSKPIYFWNDENRNKFKSAYFEKFENSWCHGDFAEKTKSNGFIIFGRSDATLNPGGVRIGTAEIYRQVEALPEIEESIVIGQDWQNDVRIVLFVKLKSGLKLNSELINKIKHQIRQTTTPRHVPSKIIQVNDIPRTKSGKIVEIAVKQTVQGQEIQNKEALANPEALTEFKNIKELLID